MDFCSLEGLQARFGELLLLRLTDDNGIGQIDAAKVGPAIAAISGEISGYLRDRYSLPLASVPAELQNAAEDMALERIYSGKPERETPKDVKDRAAAARSWLRDVKKGVAALDIPADLATQPTAASPNTIKTVDGTSSLSNDMGGF